MALVGSGLLAYRYVFHRAGEEAVSLIPSDSLVVATADLGPSPDQVALFGRIARAMLNEKADGKLETAAATTANGSTFLDEIRPQLGLSYAFGCWKRPGSKSDDDYSVVGLAGIKSPSDVEAVAAKHGVLQQQNGLSYYRIRGEKLCVTVIKQYLVVSDDAPALFRIRSVSNGDTPSVASLKDYKDARARLPADANIMGFLNMTAASATAKQRFGLANANVIATKGWAACGATLRNKGVEVVWNAPCDASNPLVRLMQTIKPIDTGLYNRLPSGAYGLLVFAQPGAYYTAKDSDLGLSSDDKKGMQEGLTSFEKETGLNITRDLVSGLQGNLTLAVYPAREAAAPIPDGLILVDDSNGADPAAMVEKIKDVIARECVKNHDNAPTYRSEQVDGATVWTLDERTEKSLRDQSGLEKSVGDDTKVNVAVGVNGVDVNAPGANVHVGQNQAGQNIVIENGSGSAVGVDNRGVQITANGTNVRVDGSGVHFGAAQESGKPEEKQLVFAYVGKSVLITSSRSLLDKAIAVYHTGKSSIASDPAFAPMLQQLAGGAQQALMVDVPGIMERLRHPLTDSMSASDPTGPKPDDVVKLFGARGNGLVYSQGYDGKLATGILFIPIDYERAIHLIGAQKTSKKGTQQTL